MIEAFILRVNRRVPRLRNRGNRRRIVALVLVCLALPNLAAAGVTEIQAGGNNSHGDSDRHQRRDSASLQRGFSR
jgi:hypothetical protein